MKRDMDLIRQIMLAVETSNGPTIRKLPPFDDRSEEVIAEHARLAFDAGLLEGTKFQPLSGPPQFANIGLTWRGHEFLEQTRDPEIWEKTKVAAGKVGSSSLPLLMELAAGYVKAKAASLGIPMM